MFGFAQTDYPLLPVLGGNLQAFIPNDWTILAVSNGDLNKDNKEDIVFIIEKSIQNLGDANGLKINKLRIFVVLVKDKNNLYNKVIQSNSFIISDTAISDKDPFESLKITDEGFVDIAFQVWHDITFKELSNYLYRFVFQNNSLELITFNQIKTNRGNGDTTEYIVDFIAKKFTTTSLNYLKGTEGQVNTVKLDISRFKNLAELQKPFMWEFMGLNI